jgi:hypothetical protein
MTAVIVDIRFAYKTYAVEGWFHTVRRIVSEVYSKRARPGFVISSFSQGDSATTRVDA